MMLLTGEVRKVIPNEYTDKSTGEVKHTAMVILEPENTRKNYEFQLSAKQCDQGAIDKWSKIKGQKASVEVRLYTSWEHKFNKYNAVDPGTPQVFVNQDSFTDKKSK